MHFVAASSACACSAATNSSVHIVDVNVCISEGIAPHCCFAVLPLMFSCVDSKVVSQHSGMRVYRYCIRMANEVPKLLTSIEGSRG